MSLFARPPLMQGAARVARCASAALANRRRRLHTTRVSSVQRLLWAGAVLDETSPRLRPATSAWMSALGMGQDADYGLSFTHLAASSSHSLLAYRTLPPSGYEIPAPPETAEDGVYPGQDGTEGPRLLPGEDTASSTEDPIKYVGLSKIISIGRNTFSELGLGFSSHESTWGMVQSQSNFGGSHTIKQLAAGLNTSWAVTRSSADSSDMLFAWGNQSLGQLGLGGMPGQGTSTSGDAQLQLYSSPRQVTLPPLPNDEGDVPYTIDKVAVGLDHALVLRSWKRQDGGKRCSQILGCGLNTDAQLGLPLQITHADTLTPIISEVNLSGISAGGDTSIAFNSGSAHALAWGNSEYAQAISGSRPLDRIEAPVSIDTELTAALGGESVKDIANGGSWTLVLTDAGRVLSVGYGAIGCRQADGTPQNLNLQPIPALETLSVRAIASGLEYACAITIDERIFVWGLDSPFGRLGLGARQRPQQDYARADPRVFTPTEVALPPSVSESAYSISNVALGRLAMEYGTHCRLPECNRLDFLPISCPACREQFCNSHYLPAAHACSAPGAQALAEPALVDPEARKAASTTSRPPCPIKGCKRLTLLVEPQKTTVGAWQAAAGATYSSTHRDPSAHGCTAPTPKTEGQRRGELVDERKRRAQELLAKHFPTKVKKK
ncbi:hypothetical protein OC835_002101 [Tilletia horrida]|nr:hypothetical protein OC835_002101 [Tilletia horrida]